MAKKGTRVEVNTFVKGLVTEASPLNFPLNAMADGENFELNRDGSLERRLGFDFSSTVFTPSQYIPRDNYTGNGDSQGRSSAKWVGANGDSTKEFAVLQYGSSLYFFDLSRTTGSMFIGQMMLNSADFPSTNNYQFAAIEGKLVVTAGGYKIGIISYNPSGGTFALVSDSLLTRDVWGLEEITDPLYETDPHYSSLSGGQEHDYNLRNQSWKFYRQTSESGSFNDPISTYQFANGKLPSNSETVWTGLQFAAGNSAATPPTEPREIFFPKLYAQTKGATPLAPKGFYIIDLLKRGPSRKEADSRVGYPNAGTSFGGQPKQDTTPGGATAVCEFAGRVFYAGFSGGVIDGDKRSPNLSDMIFFSQLVSKQADIVKCYQEGDPTSRESNETVDTDGGFIKISGAKNLLAMRNMETHLVVFASNGIWAVSGGSDFGFSATNYNVSKISEFGCLSNSVIVSEGGRIFYWGDSGIFVIGKDKLGDLSVESISRGSIQELYDRIPSRSRKLAVGVYDRISQKVRWIYQTGTQFNPSSVTKELVLDTTLGAFYSIRIANTAKAEILTCFSDKQLISDDLLASRKSSSTSIRYVVLIDNGVSGGSFALAHYQDTTFKDWKTLLGTAIDAQAFLLTGAMTGGDTAITKQIPYLTMHFLSTETGYENGIPRNESSCLGKVHWDWSTSPRSEKWTNVKELYRHRQARFAEFSTVWDSGDYEVVTTKSKMRGRGRSFALHLETSGGKDCRILGWNITLNGNSVT